MLQYIIFPILMIGVSFFYMRNLFIRRKGFLKEDLFSNSMALKGWMIGILIFIVGVYFLINGILKCF